MSRLNQVQLASCPRTGQITMVRRVGDTVMEEQDVTMAVMAAAIETIITQGPEPLTLFGEKSGQKIKFTLSFTQEVTDED